MTTENGFQYIEQLRKNTGVKKNRFQELERYIGIKAREKGVPVTGQFELTPLCNLNCKMCYVHLSEEQMNGQSVLPVEKWKHLMYQAWEAGMITASLSGGECLTYPGFDEIYLYLHSLGCEVSVLTNGLLLDDKRIRFFMDHMPAFIQVTLYGWNDDIYERVTGRRVFETVKNNVMRALEAGLPLHLTLTPNIYLGEDLLETIRIAKQLCKKVIINNCFSIPREETGRSGQWDDVETELYIRAYQYSRKLDGYESIGIDEKMLPPSGGPCHETKECGLQCGGGRSSFMIDWKGTMMPCTDLLQICAYPLKDGFANAWLQVNKAANNWPRVPECIGCAYEKVCTTCAANMLKYAEPGKLPSAVCNRTKEMAKNGIVQIPECE